LISLFVGLTQRAPLLVLLEDVHWIDPSSSDVFGRIIERLQDLRVLIVATSRPELTVPWVGRALVTALSLNRFGRRQTAAMVARITGDKALPSEVLEQILFKTDGIPLFVEELTKTVLESGLLREEDESYVFAKNLTPLEIPSTLQDSLMARLDRLAPVKQIAQIGAAIGREFSHRMLEAVSPVKGVALESAIRELITSELIYARGAQPEAVYVFKHALVQDAAYASLLRSRRQRIHADIAEALTKLFADKVEAAPAVIAHHYTEAGLSEPAVRYWLVAAERALSRSAPIEANRHLDTGLSLICRLPEGPDRRALELALYLARTNALLLLKGYSAPETVEALTNAKKLVDAGVGTDLQRFGVLMSLWTANYGAARMSEALGIAGQIAEIANRQSDSTFRLLGNRALGSVQFFSGHHRTALETLKLAELHRDPARYRQLSYRFGIDLSPIILCYKQWVLLFLGLNEQAQQVGEQVRAEMSEHPHAPTIATCTFFSAAWVALLAGDAEACEQHSADLVAYCTENKVHQFRLFGGMTLASARSMREPTTQNIEALRSAIDEQHRSGAHLGDTLFLAQLAEALLRSGDIEGCEAALKAAFGFADQFGELFWVPDLHRIEGLLRHRQADPKRAEVALLKAIEVARAQEARMHEVRAVVDLARLWRETKSIQDPVMLLQHGLSEIEGGQNSRHVRAARSFLAELA
jgi:hypothetical protein